MQNDDVQVTFCDLCGASVPEADLASGAALKAQAKTLGACCLAGLRAARPDVLGSPPPGRGPAAESRLVVVAVVLLAAVAAATIFLDQRLTQAEGAWQARHAQLAQAQRSDSEVLQAVGVAMDGVVRRTDVDALSERMAGVSAGLQQVEQRSRQDGDELRQAVVGLQQEIRRGQGAAIDYRPLFDDLRQQLQRQAAAIAELRPAGGASAAPAAAPEAPAAVPMPAAVPPDASLPKGLVDHLGRLQSADPAVRFEAVDELARSRNPQVLPHLLPLAEDVDPFVRRVTMDGLAGFRDPTAVEALLTGLGDTDENVRDTAWRSLRELTGQKLPFDASNPSKDVRSRAQQRWREWWDKNKATFASG
ncbi:MAG: HEAT repeat domain-containing protein [Planctomycetes bacterium]|nr:HEAT repeat domain-containing protein [Planctomycetota bacterium]